LKSNLSWIQEYLQNPFNLRLRTWANSFGCSLQYRSMQMCDVGTSNVIIWRQFQTLPPQSELSLSMPKHKHFKKSRKSDAWDGHGLDANGTKIEVIIWNWTFLIIVWPFIENRSDSSFGPVFIYRSNARLPWLVYNEIIHMGVDYEIH
jgi:hypothetical protein